MVGGGGDKDRVLKGKKKIGIYREHRNTSREEGEKPIYFRGTREQTTCTSLL